MAEKKALQWAGSWAELLVGRLVGPSAGRTGVQKAGLTAATRAAKWALPRASMWVDRMAESKGLQLVVSME